MIILVDNFFRNRPSVFFSLSRLCRIWCGQRNSLGYPLPCFHLLVILHRPSGSRRRVSTLSGDSLSRIKGRFATRRTSRRLLSFRARGWRWYFRCYSVSLSRSQSPPRIWKPWWCSRPTETPHLWKWGARSSRPINRIWWRGQSLRPSSCRRSRSRCCPRITFSPVKIFLF